MKSDLDRLQGTWAIVALEVEGQTMTEGVFGGSKIIVQSDHFTTIAMGATYEGTLTVDASRKPKRMDMRFTAGPEAGNTSYAIYELDGDTWRICLTIRGSERPKKFATTAGSGLGLETFKRESQGSIPVADEAAEMPYEPAPELEGEWSMTSCIRDGQQMDDRFLASARRVTHGNETTMYFGSQVFMKALFTIDRSRSPKTIDYLNTHGASKGKIQYGIYELEGGTLKLCFSAPGRDRPADFASTPGDGRTFTVWSPLQK